MCYKTLRIVPNILKLITKNINNYYFSDMQSGHELHEIIRHACKYLFFLKYTFED